MSAYNLGKPLVEGLYGSTAMKLRDRLWDVIADCLSEALQGHLPVAIADSVLPEFWATLRDSIGRDYDL